MTVEVKLGLAGLEPARDVCLDERRPTGFQNQRGYRITPQARSKVWQGQGAVELGHQPSLHRYPLLDAGRPTGLSLISRRYPPQVISIQVLGSRSRSIRSSRLRAVIRVLIGNLDPSKKPSDTRSLRIFLA